MFRNAAELIGCWIAPIPIVGVVIVESMFHTNFNVTTVLLFSLIVYFSAFGFTLVLGYPLYRLLARLKSFRWWTSATSGFLIGAAVTILVGHPAIPLSKGVLINASAGGMSGLCFWIVQQINWNKALTHER